MLNTDQLMTVPYTYKHAAIGGATTRPPPTLLGKC